MEVYSKERPFAGKDLFLKALVGPGAGKQHEEKPRPILSLAGLTDFYGFSLRVLLKDKVIINKPGRKTTQSDRSKKSERFGHMGSQQKQTQLNRKEQYERKLAERISFLTEKGADASKIDKDTTVKELRADIRAAAGRLNAIAAKEKRTEEHARAKEEKAKAALAPPAKKEPETKAAKQKPAEEGKVKKEKKKKEAPTAQ
jgi:hypothetical protein